MWLWPPTNHCSLTRNATPPSTPSTWPSSRPATGGVARSDGSAPTVAPTTGQGLVALLKLPAAPISQLVEAGLDPETRSAHRRLLRLLADMTEKFQAMPLALAITEWLELQRRERKWMYSTRLKYMASAAGALGCLPLYVVSPVAILLSRDPFWKAAMLGAAALARRELPRQPLAATYDEVVRAVQLEPSLPVRVAICLSWMVSGRTGDVQRLQVNNVVIDHTTRKLAVTYTETKTSRVTGARCVPTAPWPIDWLKLLVRWTSERRVWLFPQSKSFGALIKIALRRANPALECRSLRRGSLQAMSRAGVPTADMLIYSGHTSEKMLLVYLGWGSQHAERANRTEQAGRALLPASPMTPASQAPIQSA